MPKGKMYIIIARPSKVDLNLSWEESLIKSCGVTYSFKHAYQVGLFLAGITKPSLNYRKAMYIINQKGAVTVQQESDLPDQSSDVTIVLGKIYSI